MVSPTTVIEFEIIKILAEMGEDCLDLPWLLSAVGDCKSIMDILVLNTVSLRSNFGQMTHDRHHDILNHSILTSF